MLTNNYHGDEAPDYGHVTIGIHSRGRYQAVRLIHWVQGLLAVILAGCDFFKFEADYLPITTFRDSKSGFYVELGQLDTISSHGYVVQVFKDANPRAGVITETYAVIGVSGMQDENVQLYVRDDCYVLEARYGFGGLITPVWRDPETGKTICFDLVPERGPKPPKSE